MSRMIARCGLVCSECPTFLATKNDNDDARKATVALYAEKFGFNLKPEDINCDGCLTVGGRHIGFCKDCEIKRCCSDKGLANCTLCEDQPCEKLIKFHEFSPDAKKSFYAILNQSQRIPS